MMKCTLNFLTVLLIFNFSQTKSFLQNNAAVRLSSTRYHTRTLSMEFEWKAMKKKADEAMKKSSDSLTSQFNTLRASGANPAILDRILVESFGALTPLNQVARVAAQGSQQLVVEAFDKSMVKEIEKAISTASLNLTPTNDGSGTIRINLPPLTEERRKELVKQAKGMCEDAKVSIRNNRRDFVEKVKQAEKNKIIDKDTSKFCQDDLQKLTDDYTKKLEALLKTKEKDLMTI